MLKSWWNRGRKFYEADRFVEAVAIWQQAVSAFKANGDAQQEAMTLGNLSMASQQLGKWTEAEDAIANSLNLLGYSNQRSRTLKLGESQNSQVLAQVLDIKGRLQLAQSKAEDALNTWRLAVDIYTKIGENNAKVRNRINQAQALQALGLYRQSQKALTEITQLLQNQPDSPLKVTGLRSLGNVFRVTGDLEKSRQVLEQSLAVASLLPDKQPLADVLLSLGNTARAQQNTQKAIEFYQQAANAATSPTTRINAQTNQLRLLLDLKHFTAFQALLPQIQTQIDNLPPSRTAVYARINLAQSLMKLGEEQVSLSNSAQLLATAVQQAKSLQDKPCEAK